MKAQFTCPVADKGECADHSGYTKAFKYNPIQFSGEYVHCPIRKGKECKLYLINKLSSTEIAWILQDPEALENVIRYGFTRPLKKDTQQAENKGETFKNTIK